MRSRFWILGYIVGLLFISSAAWSASEYQLPNKEALNASISAAESDENKTPDNGLLLNNLRDTLTLLAQIEQQQSNIDSLQKTIDESDTLLQKTQENLNRLNAAESIETLAKKWDSMSLAQLLELQNEGQAKLQQLQTDLSNLNVLLVAQRATPERVQTALAENLARSQQLNKLLFSAQVSRSLADKYHTELKLIDLKNEYNQLSLSGNSHLTSLYESEVAEKNLEQQQQQAIQVALQEKISALRLQQSQQQAEQQAEQSTDNNNKNEFIRQELQLNAKISQDLVEQTNMDNQLVQDGLRIRNMLDNLLQTQRNIEEQISALQGTLILSRIINKQRQALPTDSLIGGLSKRITDLRVRIFDTNERRDALYSPAVYIAGLEQSKKTVFNEEEKAQLTTILQDRRKLLTDLITRLNEELNHAINIELNQQQVSSISKELQSKLEQQSFWVRSNSPIDFDWFINFPKMAKIQLDQIVKLLNFSNWRDYLLPIGSLVGFLLLLAGAITLAKNWIKRKISWHNSNINTLRGDNQSRTILVLFYTLLLALPSTLLFLSVLILVIYFCFQSPLALLPWALKMAAFWFFIAFLLSLLRPNGIAYKHFNFSATANGMFRSSLKRSIPILVVLLNASTFTSLEETGIANDYLGEALIITALLFFLFQLAPSFSNAIKRMDQELLGDEHHPQEHTNYQRLFKFFRLLLLLIPISLILLIGLGYYYTALTLIKHIIYTYVVLILWINIRELTHRAIRVSSRQLAYRRLKELREKESTEQTEFRGEEKIIDAQDEKIALSTVNQQVTKLTDILLWILLLGLFYWVWSDLLSVAYYLDNVSLWQQTSTAENGASIVESVTLLNFLSSMVILWGTYLVVRNLSGILEILVFSRVRLSQGSPYAITTILSYAFVALGAGVAFSSLGMSWSKLQWLFAALSVGLGFGLQEIFANFVSGIIILFERPVRIGDLVTIGEFSGTVSKIRIRATTIVDFDGKEVIVPNKAFVTERLTNWSLTNTTTRVVLKVGVAYGSDLELTRDLLYKAASEAPFVLEDPAPLVYFLTFGASTLDHELRVYVNQTNERNKTVDFLNRRIDQLFKENNIEIAFNQLDVYIKNGNGQQLQIEK
ncbi:mechanosensitive channel MscK [Testudinibacter sp. TR-2022]|uniref:mechanosensitive channel MscK n=1 Tax=Testudinibacter sp. TR-2022 TaxID=2585029 RepID=UPI00111BC97E|nr:mechanosensitive channel MscK [Testudinibacter sp. TR-2022]TNH07502.1 mechanosensitive channel MscK [Pasteurellaceae bacterium Phil11]TNH22673.1 mechanosensitive channel MscK [Testudinibacter sp. TR-2022]TNH28950.1 mechanosensitive channel MscK [Testudinibacter sp. TR-2022]